MHVSIAQQISEGLGKVANPSKAGNLQRFFKTGKGEYGEGDFFLGVSVPVVRRIAKAFNHANLGEVRILLRSKYHEERLAALVLLIEKFQEAEQYEKEKLVEFYLENIHYVNNWDLVDMSAPNILGAFLLDKKDRSLLFSLAKSENIWARRISIISTQHFIKKGQISYTLRISAILLSDSHDLIHKAVGWMLREVCKKSPKQGEAFLKKHLDRIPRTALRYAIEKFPERKRAEYLKKGVSIKLRSNRMPS